MNANIARPVTCPTDPRFSDSVTVARSARVLREALSKSRRGATVPLSAAPADVRNLVKRVDAGRVRVAEHTATLVYDLWVRRASRADLEAYPRALLAFIDMLCVSRESPADFRTLLKEEAESGAVARCAEMEMLIAPGRKSDEDACEAIDRHLTKIHALSDALHRAAFDDVRIA